MKRAVSIIIVTLAAIAFASSAAAQSGGGYVLTRSTLEPGGIASGEDYEARGTLGQPDAGTASGGGYTVTGGFRPEPVPIPTLSEWGLVVLTLSLLTGAKMRFGRRQANQA